VATGTKKGELGRQPPWRLLQLSSTKDDCNIAVPTKIFCVVASNPIHEQQECSQVAPKRHIWIIDVVFVLFNCSSIMMNRATGRAPCEVELKKMVSLVK
jgi:hypothetical protein